MAALILASGSRYRRELLERIGLPFESRSPFVDESPQPGELAGALAVRLAHAKAASLARLNTVVIGSDQVAALDGRILGKPGHRDANIAQLVACQGREVIFHTAVCVISDGEAVQEHLELTRVRFRRHSRTELERYVDSEPAFDCAGGFKAEGLGITLFEAIESHDPTALIGLPLIWLADALSQAGLNPLAG